MSQSTPGPQEAPAISGGADVSASDPALHIPAGAAHFPSIDTTTLPSDPQIPSWGRRRRFFVRAVLPGSFIFYVLCLWLIIARWSALPDPPSALIAIRGDADLAGASVLVEPLDRGAHGETLEAHFIAEDNYFARIHVNSGRYRVTIKAGAREIYSQTLGPVNNYEVLLVVPPTGGWKQLVGPHSQVIPPADGAPAAIETSPE